MLQYKMKFLVFLIACCSLNFVSSAGSKDAPKKRVCRSLISYHTIVNSLSTEKLPKKCGPETNLKATCCPKFDKLTGSALVAGYRVSDEKCLEYGESVFKKVPSLLGNESAPDESLTIPVNLCRLKVQDYKNSVTNHRQQPIVRAGVGEFPHMAELGYDDGNGKVHFLCAGTLISESYVLTAAHCTNDKTFGNPKFVRLGLFSLGNQVGKGDLKYYTVAETLQYVTFLPTLLHYDNIALVKLQQTVDFGLHIRPACLATEFDDEESKAIATTFGRYGSRNAKPSLIKTTLNILPHDECDSSFEDGEFLPTGIRNKTQLCVRSPVEFEEECSMVPGGPMQVFHPSQYCMYKVIGISSYINNCFTNGTVSLYTRIPPYLDWIEGIVWGDISGGK